MVSASYDKTVKLWDLRARTFTPIQTMDDFTDSVSGIQVRDAEIYTSCIDGCTRVYDVRLGKLIVDNVGRTLNIVGFCFVINPFVLLCLQHNF